MRRRRTRRGWSPRTLALAGAVAVAGGAALLGGGGGGDPAARVPGAPLDPSAAAAERGAFEQLADTQAAGPGARVAHPGAGALELDQITRDGDRYYAPLADGRRAELTLDPALQTLAERLLDESRAPRGAIVAMAPDGRILALAGRRTDEPKGGRTGTLDWRLATDTWAPAASVFKLVTAAALVNAGVRPADKVCYHGGLRSVLEHNLRDDKRDSRCEDLAYGVGHSQNAIIGKLAFQHLAPARLEAEAVALGWTAPLGAFAGATGELALPPAHDVEFARAAAGFAGARLSVLGGALLAATFAAGGDRPAPQLVAAIDGVAVVPAAGRRVITADTARAVAEMMVETCTSGSAAKSFRSQRRVQVAGKTGTLTRTDPFYMEHSWFVGFAPAGAAARPEIVVSVLLGNPESWHLRGHEAARRLIDRALKLEPTRPARRRGKDRTSGA